jgi:hypothetical protein
LDPGRDHSTECPTYLDAPHTTYGYDLAGRLVCISTASSAPCSPTDTGKTTFAIDALGRQRTRTVGTATDTYGYLGTSKTAYEISTGASATDSLIDSAGSRIVLAGNLRSVLLHSVTLGVCRRRMQMGSS